MKLHWIFVAAAPGAGGSLVGLLPILLIFVVFYVLLIVPQQRQRKKTQQMLSSLKTGDRVITNGGIYGTIMGFRNSVVQLQVANQVRIDVSRTAIADLQPDESDGSSKESAGQARKQS
jgi:preprotein translocase subunit YajC